MKLTLKQLVEAQEKHRFSELKIPEKSGVYSLKVPKGFEPKFVETGTGGHFHGKDPNVSKEILEHNWIKGVKIIYVGQTNNLNTRLHQRAQFGLGMPVGARGGRYIWQIAKEQWDSITIEYIVCGNHREKEAELLHKFFKENKKLPFANLINTNFTNKNKNASTKFLIAAIFTLALIYTMGLYVKDSHEKNGHDNIIYNEDVCSLEDNDMASYKECYGNTLDELIQQNEDTYRNIVNISTEIDKLWALESLNHFHTHWREWNLEWCQVNNSHFSGGSTYGLQVLKCEVEMAELYSNALKELENTVKNELENINSHD